MDPLTVVTSDITNVTCLGHTHPLIAAMAHHLWGNPSPQYLNAIRITTNQAIADTEATSIFIMYGTGVVNKCIATQPLPINLPDGKKVMSTHVCDINILGLPTVLMGHIVSRL